MNQPDPSSPLRIAVIGVGGIGSTFAFYLAKNCHHKVTVIARPDSARLAQLQRDGAIVRNNGERQEVEIASTLDEAVPYELVLVTLLAHQVDAVLPALRRSSASRIQFMFNTADPERLRDALGVDRCSFGMPFVQASLDPEGKLAATVGAGGQKSKMSDARWVEVFNAAELSAMLEPKMLLWLRNHAPLCIAFESASIVGVRRNGGASWARAMTIAHGVKESFTLIERMGYEVYPAGKARLHKGPAALTAAMLWGLTRIPSFRSLLATAEGECRALVDVLLTFAEPMSPPVRTSRIEAMRPD